jgi:Holliday junction resolvase RusA-like endonuclease
MIHLRFTLTLPPTAQQRARSRAVVRNGDDKAIAMSYKSGKQRQQERKLEALLYEHRPPEPLTGPVFLGVKAYMPIPVSKPKKWKAEALAGTIRPTTRPDLDNLLKQLKDCMTGIFWTDDKQVVGYLPGTGKYYGDPVRWEVELHALS